MYWYIQLLYYFPSYVLVPYAGGLSSYILPAAAVGAMGYCYMWWKVKCKSMPPSFPSKKYTPLIS
jgi:hypothetical protein